MPKEEVAITAMGAVTCVGPTLVDLEAALKEGRSGLEPISALPNYAGQMGGEARGLNYVDSLPRAFTLLDAAVDMAWASLPSTTRNAQTEAAVVLGTAQGAISYGEALHRGEAALKRHAAYRPGSGASRVAKRLNLAGPAQTLGMACISSAAAILQGAKLISRGQTQRAVVGGFEALSDMVWAGFDSLGVLDSRRCTPFDRNRAGLNLGEGAAVLILEPLSDVIAEGRTPLAIIRGGAIRAEGRHLAAPDPHGSVLGFSITEALKESGLTPQNIDYINAHATATVRGDPAEAAGLSIAFGDRIQRVPVSSIKAITGHCLGAAGAIEVVATVLALQGGFLPPTLGLTAPLDDCEGWDLVPDIGRLSPLANALCTWTAFGGGVATMALSGWEAGWERT